MWNQGTASDAEADASIRNLLANDLTADSAVQIALLNNRNVQATYEELGIAQGDLVQAGLLTNPVFDALLRFPDGGRGRPNLELSVSENFIELLSLPLKKEIAAAQFEAAKVRVVGEIVNLATDVKSAFYRLQGAEQMLDMRHSVVDATAASFDAGKRIREAGNTTELSLANDEALYVDAKLDLARSEAEVNRDRERLIALLGLWGSQADIHLTHLLPALPDKDPPLDDVEAVAVRQRLDLSAALKDLNATNASFGFAQRFTWLNGATLTVDGEHEVDGGWVTGPGISVPIPIFDTGAAQLAIAHGRVRQGVQRVYAMSVEVRSQARSARAEIMAARAMADYYRTSVIPLRQKITHQTQLQCNGMLTGVFQLLQAKRNEIDAGRDYIQAIQDYWIARTALERAIGGRLPSEPMMPATVPAAEPPMKMDMDSMKSGDSMDGMNMSGQKH